MPSDKYNHLIELINFKSIGLDSLKCERNSDLIKEAKKNPRVSLTHKVKAMEVEVASFSAKVGFKLNAYIPMDYGDLEVSGIPTENTLFAIDFQMELDYIVDIDDVNNTLEEYKDELEKFVENNAMINAWPYARETISSLTTRMGFPSLTIPTYKYMPKY